MAADTVSYAYNPDTSKIPEERLMIRQAEMSFKVKELQKTLQKISEITALCGGEVWNSHLETDIQNTSTKKVTMENVSSQPSVLLLLWQCRGWLGFYSMAGVSPDIAITQHNRLKSIQVMI